MTRKRNMRLAEAISVARGARRDTLLTVVECLKAADPRAMMRRVVSYDGKTLRAGGVELDLDTCRRVLVIGGGKASALMAEEIESIPDGMVTEGRVVVPDSQRRLPKLSRIGFRGSTHPLPTEKGVRALRWMLELVEGLTKEDVIVCLISGGGSALMPLPAEGVTIEQKQEVTQMLLKSGADIGEINCVREHLPAFKGGRLAETLRPARVLSLIVSDVVGNDLASVASGPTVPDPTGFAKAKAVMVKRGAWWSAPTQVRALIQAGLEGSAPETPKPGGAAFTRVSNVLIGSSREPCEAARGVLAGMGYEARIISTALEGEAREVGRKLARRAVRASTGRAATAFVAGGETTVRVIGRGRGGRNQELALSAAIGIAGAKGITVVSFGTDGIDGPTRAAGAVTDTETVSRGKALGMDAKDYLARNDSNSHFRRLGDLLVTGPTGTNVNDVMLVLVKRQ